MTTKHETRSSVAAVTPQTAGALRNAYLWVRSLLRWTVTGLYFFTVCPFLILLAIFC